MRSFEELSAEIYAEIYAEIEALPEGSQGEIFTPGEIHITTGSPR